MGVSVISLGEIQSGISRMRKSQRGIALQNWLVDELIPRFESHILPPQQADALYRGKLTGEGILREDSIPHTGALLTATAYTRQLTMVTHNKEDCARFPVELINPWNDGQLLITG